MGEKKMIQRTSLILAALSFLLAACSGAAGQPQSLSVDLTAIYTQVAGTMAAQGLLRSATPESGAVATLAPEATAARPVLLADDFSNATSGWDVRNDPEAVTDYRDGQFVILINKPSTSLWSKPDGVFSDVDIAVDVLQTAGPYKNLYGVICRYQDKDNFYRLVIGSDGFAGITKRANGIVSVISGAVLVVSDAVNQGYAANHIEAVCQGSHLALWVNGVLVAEATDDQFPNGQIGVFASSTDVGTEIHFDNFVVQAPE